LTQAKAVIDQSTTLVNGGDYVSLSDKLSELYNILNGTETGLMLLGAQAGAPIVIDPLIIGVIVAVAAGVGIVVYVVKIRKRGFKPGVGYRPSSPSIAPSITPAQGVPGKKVNLKEKLAKLKEKFKKKKGPVPPQQQGGYEGVAY